MYMVCVFVFLIVTDFDKRDLATVLKSRRYIEYYVQLLQDADYYYYYVKVLCLVC